MRKIFSRMSVYKIFQAVVIALAALSVILFFASEIGAYAIDRTDALTNSFTIALDPHTELHEVFERENNIKKIWVENTGDVNAYVRVYMELTSENASTTFLESVTQYQASSGGTWLPVSQYKKGGLNDGWVYNSDEGYFYYTKELAPGENTTDLLYGVKTTFEKEEDIVSYDIVVSKEGIGTYHGGNYREAWDAFLNE